MKLKGTTTDEILKAVEEDKEEDELIITEIKPTKTPEAVTVTSKADQTAFLEAKKKFEEQLFHQKKQLLSERKKLNKLTEELEDLQSSKQEIEAELKARNEEIYQVNEKLMMLELN